MRIGFIGLGRMGSNMVRRLVQGGHEIVVYNRSLDKVKAIEKEGAIASSSISDLIQKLPSPKIVWVMVPAGDVTTGMIRDVAKELSPGDIIIDGGNSNYKDSKKMSEELVQQKINFLDCGTSGGIWGLKIGYCMMIGGEKKTFKTVEPIFKTLAPKDGYMHTGPSGAGHFVKMIHNGIEYGLLQAYAEGFQIMEASDYDLDFSKVSHLWNQGSVVRSWLLELAESAFAQNPKLTGIKDFVEDSGEGRWTVETAIEHNVPAPVISLSLLERLRSRQEESYSAKVIAALRNEFGGHKITKK